MLHAELLHDPASIERGEELAALYIEGLHRLRADAPTKDGYHNFKGDIQNAIKDAVKRDDMDGAAYEQLGREVVEARRKHDAMMAREERGEVGTPEWHAAFQPAFDFLNSYAGNPIAAEQTRKQGNDINTLGLSWGRSPKNLGGFVIPKVIDNTGLYISRRPGSQNPIGRLQIFDRNWNDQATVSYLPCLKIAIGE